MNYLELIESVRARKEIIDDLSRVDGAYNAEWRLLCKIEDSILKYLKEVDND